MDTIPEKSLYYQSLNEFLQESVEHGEAFVREYQSELIDIIAKDIADNPLITIPEEFDTQCITWESLSNEYWTDMYDAIIDSIENKIFHYTEVISYTLKKMYPGRIISSEPDGEYYCFYICELKFDSRDELLSELAKNWEEFGLSMEDIQDYLVEKKLT